MEQVLGGLSLSPFPATYSSSRPAPLDSTEAILEASTLLVGKLLSANTPNKMGVREAIFKSWSFIKGLEISDGPVDTYIFSFPSQHLRDRIWHQGPWNIKSAMLVLKAWEVDTTFQELTFTSTPLWLQIHGLPLGHMTNSAALEYGALAGRVLAVDFDDSKKVWGLTFIRVLIQVNLSHPMFPGFFLQRSNKSELWIQFKYERISAWCTNCGRLDHTIHFCAYGQASSQIPLKAFHLLRAMEMAHKRFSASLSFTPPRSTPSRPPPAPAASHKTEGTAPERLLRRSSAPIMCTSIENDLVAPPPPIWGRPMAACGWPFDGPSGKSWFVFSCARSRGNLTVRAYHATSRRYASFGVEGLSFSVTVTAIR